MTLLIFLVPMVRLIGPPNFTPNPAQKEGRLELCIEECDNSDKWGTICDDYWNIGTANVVCRILGIGSAISAPTQARYGQGKGSIVLDDVQCTGQEGSLFSCKHSLYNNNCKHTEDAGVVCSGNI